MSKVFMPFGFFSSGKSDLPIIGQFTVSNISTNSIDVSFNLVSDGEGAPVTGLGIVYSDSVTQPDLNTPNTTVVNLSIPNQLPAPVSANLTGLDDTTTYYIRVFATNSEGTAYTATKQAETLWDAFTYVFDASRINYNTYPADLQIGNLTAGAAVNNGVTVQLGPQHVKIKISQPSNPNVTDEIFERGPFQQGRHKLFVNRNDNWDNSPMYVSIVPISGTTFNNFRFAYSEDADNEYNNGNVIVAASAIVTHWGPTQWLQTIGMYAGDTFQFNEYAPVCAADDTPDFSQCVSMHKIFQNNKRAYTNYYQPSQPNYLTAGPLQEISDWDLTNIQDASRAFYNSWAGYGYPLIWTNISWDNCVDFHQMFASSRIGQVGFFTIKADMSGWTFNTNSNADINFSSFMQQIQGNFTGVGIKYFDINNTASNKLNLTSFFSNNNNIIYFGESGYNISGWGSKINQLEPLSNSTQVYLTFMFYFCGVNSTNGMDLDLSTWDFNTATDAQYMFAYSKWDPSAPNYSTTLTNKTWGSNLPAGTSQSVLWTSMFQGTKNIPPLDNWTFNYVSRMSNMFANGQLPTAGAVMVNLSTWKTSIDALQPFAPGSTPAQGLELKADYMFAYGYNNSTIPNGIETWSWPTNANVDYIYPYGMFLFCRAFNRDLNNWNISKFNTFEEFFYYNEVFNNGEIPGASGNPLTFTGTFMTTANTVAPKGGFTAMFNRCYSFNQSVNSWGDLRRFDKDFTLGGMFNTTNAQPAVFTHDIGGWIPPCPQPGGVMGSNIAAYWTTQQIDDTLIGWAKEMLAVNFQPLGGQTGWVETNAGYNSPSCLPAAVNPGGPYTVPADITNVQDALDFFTSQLGWSVGLPPCT